MLDVVTTAVPVVGAAAVAVVVTLRVRRFDAPAAQQAPVQTAMHMMTMHTPMQRNGTTTATTIPTMTAVDKLPTAYK